MENHSDRRFETPITGLQLRYWANVLDTGLIGDLVDKDTDDLYTEDNWVDMIRKYHKDYFGSNIGMNQIDARVGQIQAIIENMPTEVIEASRQFPGDLKDGQVVALARNESDEQVDYGRVSFDATGAMVISKLWLDAMGVPHETGDTMPWQNREVIPVAIWHAHKDAHPMAASDDYEYFVDKDRIIGPITSSYPRDEGWKLGPKGKAMKLSEMTIKHMTRNAGKLRDKPPNAQKAWEARLERGIVWKCVWKHLSSYFTTPRDELTWVKLRHRALAVANRFADKDHTCLVCRHGAESMLHLAECGMIYALYWSHFFALAEESSLRIPTWENRTLFIALGIMDKRTSAKEELIGIFSIAWRCLYAEINRSRMEEVPFKMENAKRRAFCMIYNRLRGYAKACKDFCNERRHTGRKHMLPAALHTKRCLVKVQQHGEYVIHGAVEKRAKKATQGSHQLS